MKEGTITIEHFELTIGEQLPQVDQKFGAVYKCVDQNQKPHLLLKMQINAEDENLRKFYMTQITVMVLLILVLINIV